MIYKCKICGGSVTLDSVSRVAVCDYCGTKQVFPRFTDESERRLFESGNNYLQHGEYDKAESVFNQLLSIAPKDAETYWDLVLCKYGVTFVSDSMTGKYVPTCNRTYYESIFDDSNYQKAIEYADVEERNLYQEYANIIHEIQKGILEISRKEKPFDIFISYKETDVNGNRTEDSVKAQKIYEKLTENGYKVFFSRITLENKIGTEYEPYIYAALSSSKVMLTVSSSKDNLEAPWVKNEWNRFLNLRQQDNSKVLIPLYFDISRDELPDEFAIFSAQEISGDENITELVRGIKKLIPLPVMLAEKRKARNKKIKIGVLIASVVIIIGTIAAIPYIKNYIKESQEYEVAIQQLYDGDYAEAAWGFEALDSFKDSEDKKIEAEKSWRNSLATATVMNTEMGGNEYYISTNGEAEILNTNAGITNDDMNTNEHGEVVSIALCPYKGGDTDITKNPYVLYEDGYLMNSADNNNLENDWEDVIQISDGFSNTNVALKSDGTMLVEHPYHADKWIEPINEWNNIESFAYDNRGVILGLQTDGKVKGVFSENMRSQEAESFLNEMSDIKKVYVTCGGVNNDEIYILAINDENNGYEFANGTVSKWDDLDIIDAEMQYLHVTEDINPRLDIYVVNKKHELTKLGDDKVIMNDVVYVDKNSIISRNGNVYKGYIYSNGPEKLEVRSIVRDEWL